MELAALRRERRESAGLSAGPSHHSESGRVSRADTDLEPSKLSARDKTCLVWLWSLSLLYGMMTEQLVSKAERQPGLAL